MGRENAMPGEHDSEKLQTFRDHAQSKRVESAMLLNVNI